MYSSWYISELKAELTKRGGSLNGRQAELVERTTAMYGITRIQAQARNMVFSQWTVMRCITNKVEDVTTHTGQKWDSKDYRLVRFMSAPKQVNKNWAINLIAEVPPKEVSERVVWCDGGSGPEGHPRVYINLDKPGNHSCGYCGLRFVLKKHH